MKRRITINQDQVSMLERIYKHSKHKAVRTRAHFLILYSESYTMLELYKIVKVHQNTVTNWLNSWLSEGLVGLYNKPGRGRKRILTDEEQRKIKQKVKQHPQKASLILPWIKTEFGKTISSQTLKRVLKSMGMRWHRARRVLFKKPNQQEYVTKKAELETLQDLEQQGYFTIYYMDESGFSLTPYIP